MNLAAALMLANDAPPLLEKQIEQKRSRGIIDDCVALTSVRSIVYPISGSTKIDYRVWVHSIHRSNVYVMYGGRLKWTLYHS